MKRKLAFILACMMVLTILPVSVVYARRPVSQHDIDRAMARQMQNVTPGAILVPNIPTGTLDPANPPADWDHITTADGTEIWVTDFFGGPYAPMDLDTARTWNEVFRFP